MVLDEWHLQLDLATDLSPAESQRVRAIVSAALKGYCDELQERLQAEIGGDTNVVIMVSQ
jgi:hypothetical protein